MTTQITTLNSVYEVDKKRRMIRRIKGVNPPTSHFEPDGEWRSYTSILEWRTGQKVVYWPDGEVTTLSTIVSEV